MYAMKDFKVQNVRCLCANVVLLSIVLSNKENLNMFLNFSLVKACIVFLFY